MLAEPVESLGGIPHRDVRLGLVHFLAVHRDRRQRVGTQRDQVLPANLAIAQRAVPAVHHDLDAAGGNGDTALLFRHGELRRRPGSLRDHVLRKLRDGLRGGLRDANDGIGANLHAQDTGTQS